MTCENNLKHRLSRPEDLIHKVNHTELFLVGVEPTEQSICCNSDFVIKPENTALTCHEVVSSELQDLDCIFGTNDVLLDNAEPTNALLKKDSSSNGT
jgi:hypothetical protein